MNKPEYISIAIAGLILTKLNQHNDFAREGLPSIDLPALFYKLARDSSFPASDFSIAISGMGVTTTSLREIAQRVGLHGIVEFADDLHVAAEWRNDRSNHPRTIALAAGYNAGVHTLSHYGRLPSAELARTMLQDAKENLTHLHPDSPEIHRGLLGALLENQELEPLISLEACAEFLARWDAARPEIGNQAPLMILPALGLLVDEKLFEADSLGCRLAENMRIVQQVKTFRHSELRKIERRKYKNQEKRKLMEQAVLMLDDYLAAIHIGEEGALTLSTALMVTSPPKDKSEENDGVTDPKFDDDDTTAGGEISLSEASSEALINGSEEDLRAISDAIDEAWEEFKTSGGNSIEISVKLPTTDRELTGALAVQTQVLNWVDDFCNEDNWGGLLNTTETSLEDALKRAADHSPIFLVPTKAVTIEGELLSFESLLAAWDEDLPALVSHSPELVKTWREFTSIRSLLLPNIGKLIYHARSWLDGRPEVLDQVRRYLQLAAHLYHEVHENYAVMANQTRDWARCTLEILLALDVLQVRVRLADGKTAAKVILLPSHPLYLWRNERLSSLLRGLAQSTTLERKDRDVIRKELERPQQFLSVVGVGAVPQGQGLNQLLPLTAEIEGLPVFENLINTCSGADGSKALCQALDHYLILNPNHPYPLRVAIVNPPKPETLMREIVRLLNDHRYRSGHKLSAIQVVFYATAQHAERLRSALSFSDARYDDEVQEKVAADRLFLQLDEPCLTDGLRLDQVVERIRSRPCHVCAIFDESTIRMRKRTAGPNLPMSPFCIRYEVSTDHRTGRIELQPQPGESPFNEFLVLMNELEGSQRDATPLAYADAQGLAETADTILQGDLPAAQWLFIADRALPSEAGMKSLRIWERREGMRDTLLAAPDITSLARLIRPAFSQCNLTVKPDHMSRLLQLGAHLTGSGLIEIIKKDGKPDNKKVVGFAGMLIAARDFQQRYPGSLVLSVDYPLARLWLRTGSASLDSRCDLLILWKDDIEETFYVIAAEIKASNDDQLTNASYRVDHAVSQVESVLEAVSDGLQGSSMEYDSPLSIPRCEMLKQTFVRAAQVSSGNPQVDRANRCRWGSWLMELFPKPGVESPRTQLEGCVVSVLLRRAEVGALEELQLGTQWPIQHRILGDRDVQGLLDWQPYRNVGEEPAQKPKAYPVHVNDVAATSSLPNIRFEKPREGQLQEPGGSPNQPTISFETPVPIVPPDMVTLTTKTSASEDEEWPPQVNAPGMVGQCEAVDLLVKQTEFSKVTGRRFSDKLLVGPAGVGKSTLARKIGTMLFNREPLFFNGSSLTQPSDLLDRLVKEGLAMIPEESKTVIIEPCLLFIDEVHGIKPKVEDMLLSAMDDRRITTVKDGVYDFSKVIFLLATTDQGSLSEAFQSRPHKTWLRPYTLNEMAGIIWLHGKECLDGAELSKEACYEIAARNRCNPRRCVRELSDILSPHFFDCVSPSVDEKPSLGDTAKLMTAENIAQFYEQQGVDCNGIDEVARRYLNYLKQRGAASKATLQQALGLPHTQDFVEVSEYLMRLMLIQVGQGGRTLTAEGKKYLNASTPPDLRGRISRAMRT